MFYQQNATLNIKLRHKYSERSSSSKIESVNKYWVLPISILRNNQGLKIKRKNNVQFRQHHTHQTHEKVGQLKSRSTHQLILVYNVDPVIVRADGSIRVHGEHLPIDVAFLSIWIRIHVVELLSWFCLMVFCFKCIQILSFEAGLMKPWLCKR